MNTTDTAIDAGVRDLVRDAAEWRLMGRLFECPSNVWHADLASLARELDDASLRAAAKQARTEATEGLFHSVFGPGGPAPPREVSYHDSLELGTLMSALTSCYDAFGYAPATIETPDHVAVEVGFVAYLRLKEAYALTTGDQERAAMTRRAAARFTTDHLSMMAEPLAALLAGSGIEYLAHASVLLAARVGPKPKSKRLPVLQADPLDDESGSEFACDV